jgi:hypothetical protein
MQGLEAGSLSHLRETREMSVGQPKGTTDKEPHPPSQQPQRRDGETAKVMQASQQQVSPKGDPPKAPPPLPSLISSKSPTSRMILG